ncbi:MAG: hypothetical protein NT013_24165 [Planctomycetia bacterium]|nr:hypothetical protein [Planctomycetia bacterium]
MADPRPEWTATFEQTLMASDDRELLGIPKSWQCVRQGLHPFSPERTLILPSQAYDDSRQVELAQQIGRRWDDAGASQDSETILRIVQAASILTQVYGVQERTEDWVRRLLVWLFEFYSSVAQDHQWVAPLSWQGHGQEVKTSNGIVDWWLILIPQGVEVSNIDGTRLHTLITPIYTEVGKPRLPVEFWDFMARAIGLQPKVSGGPRSIDTTWLDISHMDRKSACLSINQRIAANLTKMA